MVGAPDNSNSVLNADNLVFYPGGSSNFNERTGTYTSGNGPTVPTRPTPTTNPAGYRVNNQNTLYYKQY
jgi:hypothetical protein